ncbi:hypothetical protein QN277_007306 [Acacia crassicarpa]|uniref:Uncharacterized protein n=1 Tax=Acacia crassicarpa TaxID=499986 RepID=A0AAE1IVQ4_9FABA|nr:hypothetical protein QN277_007306 [Acacia crassicarpa]
MSAFALGILVQVTHNQVDIAYNGGIYIKPLLNLLYSKDGTLQYNVACFLYYLADNEDNIVNIVKLGGVQKLQDGPFNV